MHLLLSMSVMFCFICMGFTKLWGTGRDRNNEMKIYVASGIEQALFKPVRLLTQRFIPFRHNDLCWNALISRQINWNNPMLNKSHSSVKKKTKQETALIEGETKNV